MLIFVVYYHFIIYITGMLSVSQLCRCSQPLRSALLSGTRSGLKPSNLVTRQLYTPLRHGNTNKMGFRVSTCVLLLLLLIHGPLRGQSPILTWLYLLMALGLIFASHQVRLRSNVSLFGKKKQKVKGHQAWPFCVQ